MEKESLYTPILNEFEINELIDKVITWYEFNYKEIKEYKMTGNKLLEDFEYFEKNMKLTKEEKEFLNCYFRKDFEIEDIFTVTIYIKNNLNKVQNMCVITANKEGYLRQSDLRQLSNFIEIKDEIDLEKLYILLRRKENIDLKELKKIYYTYQIDSGMRKKFFTEVINKLAESKTESQYRRKRAKVFELEYNYLFKINKVDCIKK